MDNETAREDLKRTPLAGFLKANRGFVGDRDRVVMPARSKELDYEVEMAAVIGRSTKDAQSQSALDNVFGYTGLIDYSLRDQSPNNPSMLANKNFDGCGALGPCIVTKDEVPNPQNVSLELKVNGEIRQRGTTSDMVHPYSELIAWFSRDLTLRAGDMVSGGTCSGTALEKKNSSRDWSWFLKPGDKVESTVGNIGTIRNEIVSKDV